MVGKVVGWSVSAGVALIVVAGGALASKVETWKQETASAFNKGKRERVVISDSGRVALARKLSTGSLPASARVWDLAKTPRGVVYAATGDEGKVYVRERDKDSWTLAYDATDGQALSLAASGDGRVFLGTGPTGQVVELTDEKKPASRPDPSVFYIWDLAIAPGGELYAATGPGGRLWKRSTRGEWSLLFKSKHQHLLCVAVGQDGAIYTGSDGEGLLYKISPEGKASVVFDAPQSEIRVLAVGSDGAIVAGTAAEAGGGSGSSRSSATSSLGSSDGSLTLAGATSETIVASASLAQEPAPKKANAPADPPAKESSKSPGTAAPKAVSPGDNAVYRIGVDGVPREIFRAKALIHALAFQGDRLMVGTGPEGLLYDVNPEERESTPIARLDHGQILALLAESPKSLLIGTGDPGSVARLESEHVPVGTLTSDVFDAKLSSRFGSITWRETRPPGTSISVQVRSGNVGEPDETWSAWSAEQTDPSTARASAPLGRFVQYRVLLRTDDPAASPELRGIALRYQTANLPPEINKLEVPDVNAADGATRQTKLNVRWEATDPNSDDLLYSLHVKKDGWPNWLPLTEKPTSETRFEWDVTALPAGSYRVKLSANDRSSNAPAEALTAEKESELFLIDHEPPSVTLERKANRVLVSASDRYTRLTKAAFALDGGEWKPIFPEDSLFDSPKEALSIDLPELGLGFHVILVRVTDAAGNLGTGELVFEVR
ncbi:MAG: hypothetical protein SFX72_04965 [Isosphaeraceae bacterium]|nr:hypothetical protein [Isosphaeraceae bacterium]